MANKVFIQSIPRKTATLVSEFKNDTSQKSLGKTKIGKCTTRLMPLYNTKTGGLSNYISYTPWLKEDGTPYTDDRGNALTLQDKMEQKYNKEKGFFTNAAPTRSQKPNELTYFQSTAWVMNDGTTVFDIDTEYGEMGYYVALASKLVANSETEYRQYKWPSAEFFIAKANESEELQHQKTSKKRKAIAALDNVIMTLPMKRKFFSLLGLGSSNSTNTEEKIDNTLYEYLDKSAFTPGSNIDKFNALITLLSTAPGREEFEARYLLQHAIDTNIIRVKGDTYTWLSLKGAVVIGDRYKDAVAYLMNPKKQDEVIEITEMIESKIK